MEKSDFFRAFFITFVYLGFVGLVFWGKDGLVLAAVLSLIVSGYSDLISDKIGGMAGRLLRGPKASWSQKEMLSGDLKAIVEIGTRNPNS